jgi:uncharacterized UBP type Zn finger protein
MAALGASAPDAASPYAMVAVLSHSGDSAEVPQ